MSTGRPDSDDWNATAAGFHTTHWTAVLAAGAHNDTLSKEALANLCSVYWQPIYAFIRRQGSTPHEAEDLTQAFFFHFLEKQSITRVTQAAGKFRTFLLTCAKNFLTNEREHVHAQKRGSGQKVIPLENHEAESHYQLETANRLSPDSIYQKRWALALLECTLSELRREYNLANKEDVFEDLQAFLPCGHGETSRVALATRRGVSVGAIDVALHRLRQRFGAILREQVRRTVSSDQELEEEIRYLMLVIST